jgi:hypothetical protein
MYFKRCVVLGEELDMQHNKEAEKNCRYFTKKTEWIRTAKELPPKNEFVLAYVHQLGMRPRQEIVVWIDGKDKFFVDGYGREVFNISHWRPLPEPPEHKSKGE